MKGAPLRLEERSENEGQEDFEQYIEYPQTIVLDCPPLLSILYYSFSLCCGLHL